MDKQHGYGREDYLGIELKLRFKMVPIMLEALQMDISLVKGSWSSVMDLRIRGTFSMGNYMDKAHIFGMTWDSTSVSGPTIHYMVKEQQFGQMDAFMKESIV